jgi:hypothetical protein
MRNGAVPSLRRWNGDQTLDKAASLKHVAQLFDRHFVQFGYPASLTHFVVDGLLVRVSPSPDALSVLADRESWIDNLLPSVMPTNYRLYRNYKIVLHQGRFYAVPRALRRFSIVGGVVVAHVDDNASGAILRLVSTAKKYIRRIPILNAIARFAWRMSRDFLGALSLRLRAIPVFSDTDIHSLLQRIDHAEPISEPR